jgi:hypothetical protein
MTIIKVTVSLDPVVAERARRDVAEGKAKSLSACLTEAGRARVDGKDLAIVPANTFASTASPPPPRFAELPRKGRNFKASEAAIPSGTIPRTGG